ncbi:MAG: macrolide 2-phosphotransferase, partial [Microbacteriaceae bacterium]|nr:macrolide 2-phosphotransferase [Microbacteriaceae bacterium]
GAPTEAVADAAFDAYTQARGATDRQIRQRARLYSELEIAKWLLHGTQERSTEIVDDAVEMLGGLVTVMDRASATNLVPAALLGRWERATEDSALWQFAPTVVNGSLSADSYLSANGEVTGVLGWHNLSVGDPARDLYWLLGAPTEAVADAAFDAYTQARGATDRQIRQRARLYSELEIAKWLLHGTQERSTEIVDDAVEMLGGLVDSVQGDMNSAISHNTMPVMAVTEVQAMLDTRHTY